MTNIKLEAMITKIREILSGKGLTERDFDEATKELLDLYNVSNTLTINNGVYEYMGDAPLHIDIKSIEDIGCQIKQTGEGSVTVTLPSCA